MLLDTKKLITLNNIGALLKGVLFDLRARNFVHARIFLHARCVHARHRARNLPSPDSEYIAQTLLSSIIFISTQGLGRKQGQKLNNLLSSIQLSFPNLPFPVKLCQKSSQARKSVFKQHLISHTNNYQ